MGSTEWMEEYIPWLTGSAVAYLNIDGACSGPRPSLSATGDLHTIAVETMRKVIFPQGEAMNETLFDVWFAETEGVVGVLGSGSDYTSFLHRGISSVRAILIFPFQH